MMGDLGEINVGMIKDSLPSLSKSSDDDNPITEMIGADRWGVAEKETQRIFSQFQATVVSEEMRREVIGYVQRLLGQSLGCEVFPYGSVPLKTYLPDGDIDLTVFGGVRGDDTLANDIVSALEAEEKNINAKFVVKDVQLVRAEVKLVKCIVQNIVVDISLNQIGGLSTLCFLEQGYKYVPVLRRDLSTFGTVDRVIGKDHLFKQSIILIKAWCFYESRILGAHHGLISTYALETLVLYIFHVFHSTLDGPLAVLYRFLDYFSKFDWETYCLSLNGPVSISALPDLSAEMPQKLSHNLLLRKEFLKFCYENFSAPIRGVEMNSRAFPPKYLNIVDPLKKNNNLGRSVSKGNFYRIRSAFTFGAQKLSRILTSPIDDIARELQMFFSSTLVRHGRVERLDLEVSPPKFTLNGELRSSIDILVLEGNENLDKNMVFLENRVTGDAKDFATTRLEGCKISNQRTKISPPRDKETVSPFRMPPHAPHLYFSKEWLDYKKTRDGDMDGNQSENFEKNKVVASQDVRESNCAGLSGDFQSHLISLQHGRWFYEYFSSVRAMAAMSSPPPQPFPASFEGGNLLGPLRHPFQQFKRNGVSHGNVNGVTLNPMFYIPSQMPKHRGTGTYLPNLNRPVLGVSPSLLNGSNLGHAAKSLHTNNRAFECFEQNMHDRSNIKEQLGTDIHQSYPLIQKLNHNANGFIPHPEIAVAKSGSVDHHKPSLEPLVPVNNGKPKFPPALLRRPQMTGQGSPAPTIQRLPAPRPNRLMVKKPYHLKNEEDFPPLSSF